MLYHFVIQTEEGKIRQDFGWTLREAIEYANWYNGKNQFDVTYVDEFTRSVHPHTDDNHIIPVGSLEWVKPWWERVNHKEFPSPEYIPEVLQKPEWLGRELKKVHLNDVQIDKRTWIKSATVWKGFMSIVNSKNGVPDDTYWVAPEVDFVTEWRAFVYHNQLVGLQNYLGDFTVMPNVAVIKEMINAYGNRGAYTLDVGVVDGNTVIVEVHPFVSCGLYGFDDLVRLPLMIISGWNELN